MSDYDNKLSGALFKNDKGDNPKRPDYKGSYTDGEGREFWVSSWLKESKNGTKFLSLSMELKQDKPKEQPSQVKEDPNEGDLPF